MGLKSILKKIRKTDEEEEEAFDLNWYKKSQGEYVEPEVVEEEQIRQPITQKFSLPSLPKPALPKIQIRRIRVPGLLKLKQILAGLLIIVHLFMAASYIFEFKEILVLVVPNIWILFDYIRKTRGGTKTRKTSWLKKNKPRILLDTTIVMDEEEVDIVA